MFKSRSVESRQALDNQSEKRDTDFPSMRSTIIGPRMQSDQAAVVDQVAAVVQRYTLVSKLGSGGFAEVWKGYDNTLKREVAIKIPHDKYCNDPGMLKNIQAEAEKLASLNHPGIVSIYDICNQDGKLIIVSELKTGGTLAERMRLANDRFGFDEVVDWVASLAESLHVAHRNGLIHRDIKPGNILFDGHGQPSITDFGLACTEQDQLFESKAIIGTISYMSPEQAQGNNKLLNPQTDIYSLGVILYELLTGRLPFVSAFILDYQDQVVNRPPRPPRTIEDSIPAELEKICLKCLEKAPADRYTTAKDLAKALRGSLDSGNKNKNKNRHLVLLAVPFIVLAGFAAMLLNAAKAPEEQNNLAALPLLSSEAINESEPNISSTKLSKEIVKLAYQKPVVTLTPLVWPQDYGVSDFSVFKGNSAVRFNAKGAGLMGFNAPQSKIQSFDVIVNRQYELFGTGVFFNHYINNEKQRGYFDTVQLKMFGEKPNMKLHLYRKGYTYNLKQPDFSNYVDTETSNRVSLETPDRSHVRLRIILEGTKLREVYVDGKLYSKICDAKIDSEKNLEKETSNIPYEVDCGLFAFNSVGTFSNLRINDQDVLVSKE